MEKQEEQLNLIEEINDEIQCQDMYTCKEYRVGQFTLKQKLNRTLSRCHI